MISIVIVIIITTLLTCQASSMATNLTNQGHPPDRIGIWNVGF